MTEGSHCSKCGEVLVAQETIDALGHDWENATCTVIKTCKKCGATEGETLEHTVVIDAAVAPTCTTAGKTEGKHCSACNEVLVAQEVVAAKGHTEVIDAAVAATCTTAGKTEGKHCSVCNEVFVAQETIDALGHTAGADATCETAQTCTVCGVTLNTALGHTAGADATCETAQTCTVCGVTLTAALGHTAGADATCETAQTCTVCGVTLNAALGHDWKAGSCTEGSKTCSRCNETTGGDGGHTAGAEATCETAQTCTVCGVTLNAALGHIETKFTGDFLYRVGNKNSFDIGFLFNIANKEGVTFTVTPISNNVSVTINGNQLKFVGTGIVKVTITRDCTCDECELELVLEVIDATNLTSASGTIEGGVLVLLCDVNTSNYVNYWNCTLYGNGFTYSLKGAPTEYNGKQGHGVIITQNATLDNLVIIGDIYNSYGAYTNQSNYNAAVHVKGGHTVIQNCYVSNCAAPVKVDGGNATIINSTLYGGAVANLIITSGTTTLENVTTANYDDGREVVGLGIVFHPDAKDNAKLVLNGTLTQYNYISEDKVPTDTNAQKIHNAIFGGDELEKYYFTNGSRFVNTGIISMSGNITSNIAIIDNANTGYDHTALSINGAKGFVYTQVSAGNSVNNNFPGYTPHTQGAVPPSYSFDYTNKNYVAKADGSNDYCYAEDGKVNISMDKGDTFDWDTAILTVGKNITDYTVSMNGTDYTGKSIAFSVAGDYTVTYTYTDSNNYTLDANGNITTYSVTYTQTVHVTVAVVEAATKHAEFTFGSSNTASTTVTIGNSTYVMPNVSGTSSTIGSTTINGQTVYYPIVEIIMSDGKTSHSSGWYAYFPVFSGAVTITDYSEGGTSDVTITYNGSTTTMPSSLSVVGDPTQLFKYQSSSSAGATPVVKSNKLVYSSPSISAKRSEYSTVIEYTYTDNAGVTYHYYIGYHAPAQSYSSVCLTPDTNITMADGTQKEIQDVRVGDTVIAWNFYTGKYEVMPVSLLQKHETGLMNVLHLYFEDGTELKVLGEHGIFDADLNTFIFIDEDDVTDYLGHSFVKQDGSGFTTVKLVGYEVVEEYTTAYTILSFDHYNVIANGMFTVTPAHVGGNFFNPFDIGEDMKYDEEKVQADIEKYGLYTYEDFAHVLTYEQFVALNLGHFKVSVGKGYITYEGLIYLIENFINNNDYNVAMYLLTGICLD